MSLEKEFGPQPSVQLNAELETLVERIVETTIARIEGSAPKPFIGSKECAALIGVTPEHLCAMRARGEGPPWSGSGKWIRYEPRTALTWLANLPRGNDLSPNSNVAVDSVARNEGGNHE